MADRKVSELTALTTPTSVDLLLIIDDPTGSPVSKKITLADLFGNINSNTSISATLSVSGNTVFSTGKIQLTNPTTVTSNSAAALFGGTGHSGKVFWDENYLYVATSDSVIKRVALSTFS